MATAKTVTTELAIAFGLLDREPRFVKPEQLANLFQRTLTQYNFDIFLQEFYSNEALYRPFYSIGVELRICYPPFENLDYVRWEGGNRQSRRIFIPKDVVAANTPISIKDSSNVVANLSPYSLFVGLLQGGMSPARATNWYIETEPKAYQQLYAYTRGAVNAALPEDVLVYHKRGKVTKAERRRFADQIDLLSGQALTTFTAQYTQFCRAVAIKSADRFNEDLSSALSSKLGNAVEDSLFQQFFRVGDIPYIICGSDKRQEFALEVPDLTTVRKEWKLKKLEAQADRTAEQSKVRFTFVIAHKKTRKEKQLNFWAEIRWSHNKFCGNPEAKLYKDFAWVDVPFFKKLYSPDRVHKIGSIGVGGFGAVYAATIGKSKQPVAVKELRTAQLRREGMLEEAQERFKREIILQSQVKHSNIMPILDYDIDASPPWFATELALHTLDDILAELPSDYRRINHIFSQLLDGLAYAHAHGLIHRDIKPSNIFLFPGDLTKLGDFGLVKGQAGTDGIAFETRTSNNSMGSIPYAAPEQLESFKDSTHLVDIFALGVTLYAMLLGYETPTTSKVENINTLYRGFIKRCIEPKLENRFQTVDEAMQFFNKEILGQTLPEETQTQPTTETTDDQGQLGFQF